MANDLFGFVMPTIPKSSYKTFLKELETKFDTPLGAYDVGGSLTASKPVTSPASWPNMPSKA